MSERMDSDEQVTITPEAATPDPEATTPAAAIQSSVGEGPQLRVLSAVERWTGDLREWCAVAAVLAMFAGFVISLFGVLLSPVASATPIAMIAAGAFLFGAGLLSLTILVAAKHLKLPVVHLQAPAAAGLPDAQALDLLRSQLTPENAQKAASAMGTLANLAGKAKGLIPQQQKP